VLLRSGLLPRPLPVPYTTLFRSPARPRAAAFAALELPERCDARSACRSAALRPRSVGRRSGAPGEWLCGARRLPGSIDRLHPGGADVVTGDSLAAVRSNGPSKEEE